MATENNYSDIEEAKKILGSDRIRCLENLYESLDGKPPNVLKNRFRADHQSDLNDLDYLENSLGLIRNDDSHKYYMLSPYALIFLKVKSSQSLLSVMDEIYKTLQAIYKKKLDAPVSARYISDKVGKPKKDLLEAIYYLTETHGVWSRKSKDFPYSPDSTISISEGILLRDSIIDVLADYSRWHLINPKEELGRTNIDHLFQARADSKLRFFSPEDTKKYPAWFDRIGDIEKALIVEIDKSLEANLCALPVMGIRALIEHIMVSRIGDRGSFKNNLEKFSDEGYLTKSNAALLLSVIDTGSAVMHRSHMPSAKEVAICIEVIKYLMHGVYILKPQTDELYKARPPRNNPKKV